MIFFARVGPLVSGVSGTVVGTVGAVAFGVAVINIGVGVTAVGCGILAVQKAYDIIRPKKQVSASRARNSPYARQALSSLNSIACIVAVLQSLAERALTYLRPVCTGVFRPKVLQLPPHNGRQLGRQRHHHNSEQQR